MTKKPTTSRAISSGPTDQKLKRTQAYQRVFSGNGTKEDADIVLVDLLDHTGFFRHPNYGEWMQRTKTPQGYELHCALQAERASVMRRVMDFLAIDDDGLVQLERAARFEAGQN